MHANTAARRALGLAALATCFTPLLAQETVWRRSLVSSPVPIPFETSRLAVLEGGQVAALAGPLGEVPVLAMLDAQANVAPLSTAPYRTSSARMESIAATDGGVFFIGEIQGVEEVLGPPIGSSDGVLAKHASDGTREWVRRFGHVEAYAVPVRATRDGSGGFIVGGRDLGAAPWFGPPLGRSWLIRFDAAGQELWRRAAPTSSGASIGITALAVDAQGVLHVAGRNTTTEAFLARFQLDGTITWYRDLGPTSGVPLEIVPLPGGRIAELRDEALGPIVCLVRDVLGNVIATVAFNGGASEPSELVGLPNGDFFVAGVVNSATGTAARFERYTPDGVLLSSFELEGAGQSVNALTDVVLHQGSLYWAADIRLPSGLLSEVVGRSVLETIGVAGCAGRPNSTGAPAVTRALGSDLRAEDHVTLFTTGLPTPNAWGFYLVSRTTGLVPNAGGSSGDLCLSGAIGRFAREGEIVGSGDVGRYHLSIDLDDIPSPLGSLSAAVGETWHFQTWYRDNNPTATSNFSSAVAVTLR